MVQAEERGWVDCARGLATREHDDDDYLEAGGVQVGGVWRGAVWFGIVLWQCLSYAWFGGVSVDFCFVLFVVGRDVCASC